jgi:phosphatidylinositol alpha-1,6-mannosyltransferase
MTRALFITERYPPDIGGVARSAERTAQALARLGVQVEVLTYTRQQLPGALTTIEHAGVTLHRLGAFANLDLSMQHATNLVEWLHAERGYDFFAGHFLYPAGFLAVTLAKMNGVPVTVSARGNDVDRMMFPPGDFARLMWTLERADLVTAVSDELAKKIGVLLGASDRIERVTNAVELEMFRPGPPDPALRKKLGIGADEVVLGFCGELRHKKGFPFLLEALVHVRATRPACLLVIGEVRARVHTHLEAFAADHPEAAARIVVTGNVVEREAVAAHYRLLDIFLQPSMWDGLPNALLEAMASGCLVLASDAGAIGEVVEHGVSGYLLPRVQLHRLGEAVEELLGADAAQHVAMRAAARARIEAAYSFADEERVLRRVLSRLLPDNSG